MPQVSCPAAAAQAGNAGAIAMPTLAAARTSRRVMTNALSDDAPRRSAMPSSAARLFSIAHARVYAASAPVVTTPKSATNGEYRRRPGSGALRRRRGFGGVAQRVTETAHGLDVILAARFRQLPAELVHKNAQLELGFVLIPIEVIEEHLFGQHRSLTHAQQFEERILLAGQPDWLTLDHDRAVIEVQQQFAGADRRLRQALRTTHDRADAGDQLAMLKRLCQEIVGAKAEPLDLVVQLAQPRKDQ